MSSILAKFLLADIYFIQSTLYITEFTLVIRFLYLTCCNGWKRTPALDFGVTISKPQGSARERLQ